VQVSLQPHKTLGHYKAPAGTSKRHLTELIQKGITPLAQQQATSPATRSQAMLFYWVIYIAYICHILPQCFFSKRALDKAQSKSIPRIIAKCGYMRTTAYSIIFGPKLSWRRWIHLLVYSTRRRPDYVVY
jgi:hypothetical protein